MRRTRTGARVVACLLLLSACGGTQDKAVADAVRALLDAVGSGDGAAACSLLAPAVRGEIEDTSGQPCERAVLDDLGGIGTAAARVEVFDTAAQAKVGSQTLFLSRFDGRWLVIGAGCTAVRDAPYDCRVAMP